MNLVRFTQSLKTLLFPFLISTVLIGCEPLPELVQPTVITPKSKANAFVATIPGSCDIQTVDLTGWGTPIINDDFTTSPKNEDPNSPWNVWVGGAFNNELQMFTSDPENLTVTQDGENSYLQIKAIRENVTGPKYRQDIDATPTSFSYTAARIESKLMVGPNTTKTQVRMVARIKLPSGFGMWPAFWSYGDNWPTNGEIDILEARGHEPTKFQTNYFYGRRANQNLVRDQETYITTGSSLTDCWHIYEVIWTKDALTFYLDGVQVAKNTGSYVPNLFGKKQKVTLNLAVGGNFYYNFTGTNANPTVQEIEDRRLATDNYTMLVDWVKVYTR
ncbi:hypothetical protein GCM10023189_11670 [Nibrella saemangeumensis]|uniref:GH16 domain-containing protein n=1 Tax=Nibrella saemangeumensis TaxID=1084526 RepID=A0ABP8MJN3_9BACT